MRRAARRWPWAGIACWKTSRTCPVKVGDVDTDMRLICREGCAESFLLMLREPITTGTQEKPDLIEGIPLCVRGGPMYLAGHGGVPHLAVFITVSMNTALSLMQGHSPCRITFLVLSSGAVVESEPSSNDGPRGFAAATVTYKIVRRL